MIKSICLRGVCVCVCFLFNSFSFFSFFLNVSLLLPALIWWKTVRLRDSRSCHFSVSLMLIKPWLSRPRGPSRLHLPLLAWVRQKKKKNPPRACKTNSSPRTSRTCTLNKIRQLRGQRQKRKKKLTLFCRLLKLMNTRTACWVKERGCWVWAPNLFQVRGRRWRVRQEMASPARCTLKESLTHFKWRRGRLWPRDTEARQPGTSSICQSPISSRTKRRQLGTIWEGFPKMILKFLNLSKVQSTG